MIPSHAALPTLFLFAFCFVFLTVMGALLITGLQRLLKPRWMDLLILPVQRLFRLIFVLIILFIPVAYFYPELLAPARAVNSASRFRQLYLTQSGFLLRSLVYFLVWGYLGLTRKVPAALFLVLVLATGSFAAIDYMMILDPEFHSTLYGLQALISGILIAYQLALLQMREKPNEGTLRDFNNFQLALIGFWTYLNLMQFITVWTANLPTEASYYLSRMRTPYLQIAIVIAVFQCAIPIVLLFFKDLKRSLFFTKTLAKSGLLFQFLYTVWLFGKGLF